MLTQKTASVAQKSWVHLFFWGFGDSTAAPPQLPLLQQPTTGTCGWIETYLSHMERSLSDHMTRILCGKPKPYPSFGSTQQTKCQIQTRKLTRPVQLYYIQARFRDSQNANTCWLNKNTTQAAIRDHRRDCWTMCISDLFYQFPIYFGSSLTLKLHSLSGTISISVSGPSSLICCRYSVLFFTN